MASTLVHSAQGGGTFSIHVHASTGWKDWASTPVHVSTGWRVRWVSRHCSQPPPRYQSRGYGSAAIAAPGPRRTYRSWCSRCIVAALALLLHCSQPPPRHHRGAMGVLLQPHSSCSARTAAAVARVSQQFRHCIRTAAKPAPLLIEGPRGCCRSRTLAAAYVLQRRSRCHAAPAVLSCTATHPCPVTTEGLRGGEGQGGRWCKGGGDFSAAWRVLFSTPVHVSTGGQISTLVRVSTGCEVEVPFPVHISAVRGEYTRGGGGGGTGSRVWCPAPALFNTGRRDWVPTLGTTALGGGTGLPTPVHPSTGWRVWVALPRAPQHKAEGKIPLPCAPQPA